jgi:predicted dehydrogenase
METKGHGLGVVGAGGFASFATGHFLEIESLELVAVSDIDSARAQSLAAAHDARVSSVDDIMNDNAIDVVYIATPPSSHAQLAMQALGAGKHVLCEKPLATTLEGANAVVRLALDHDRFAVANLLQRYNPLARAVRDLIEHEFLGETLYARVENLAADEGLPPDHWFWDAELSGGIFVEHVVHFFDLFAYWLGRGEVESAARVLRPGSGVEEQVRCTVGYTPRATPVFVDSYHGFHQPTCLDRMQTRIVFERGDVTLAGWIPTAIELDGVVGSVACEALRELFGRSGAVVTSLPHASGINGRHKPIDADRHLRLHAGSEAEKMPRYGALVREVMRDQLRWAEDRDHLRHLSELDSCEAVRLAVAATALAHR